MCLAKACAAAFSMSGDSLVHSYFSNVDGVVPFSF